VAKRLDVSNRRRVYTSSVRTIALVSQKGGSGKSSIAVHLAVAAYRKKKAVALIDLDPQGSVAGWAKRRGQDEPAVASARAQDLPRLLDSAKEQGADFVIIDTQGRVSVDVARVVALADVVLVPCRVGVYDVEASVQTAAELKAAKVRSAAFVLNAVPPRGSRHQEAREALSTLLPVCPVMLHSYLAFGDALNDGRSVEELDPNGKAAAEIRALFTWVSKLRIQLELPDA
jgi:chromosome partitioning protein